MIRAVLDWRVLAPLLAGATLFAIAEWPSPAPAEPPEPREPKRVLELPTPIAWAGPAAGSRFELDAQDSDVRFRVDTGFEVVDAVCAASAGALEFAERGRPARFRLSMELAALRAPDGSSVVESTSRLLGIRQGESIVYEGELAAFETFATAGVARVTFTGTLAFGRHLRQQEMQLWLALLVPGKVRLQGLGTVDGHAFGLPQRRAFGVFAERSRITVALDLAFRRGDR